MKYLHLKFENCGLILPTVFKGKVNPYKNFLSRDVNDYNKAIIGNSYGHDISNPVPYTLLSNVLHVLCGEIPVPTKRYTIFKRNEILDEIAKNSYIKYDNGFNPEDDGSYAKEMFQSRKYHWNSTLDISDAFKLANGEFKLRKGFYSWDYFEREYGNSEKYDIMIFFIEHLIGVNPLKLTFETAIYELSKIWETKKDEINQFITEGPKYRKPWLATFFNFEEKNKAGKIKVTGTNTSPESVIPLVNIIGITYKTTISGEIICPIDNEDILYKLMNNGICVAKLLEGGIVYPLGLEKYMPYANIEEDFIKIK